MRAGKNTDYFPFRYILVLLKLPSKRASEQGKPSNKKSHISPLFLSLSH